jgi:hypothetical protein
MPVGGPFPIYIGLASVYVERVCTHSLQTMRAVHTGYCQLIYFPTHSTNTHVPCNAAIMQRCHHATLHAHVRVMQRCHHAHMMCTRIAHTHHATPHAYTWRTMYHVSCATRYTPICTAPACAHSTSKHKHTVAARVTRSTASTRHHSDSRHRR